MKKCKCSVFTWSRNSSWVNVISYFTPLLSCRTIDSDLVYFWITLTVLLVKTFLPKLEALLSVRLCITLAPKKLQRSRKSWARFFSERPLCLPGWAETERRGARFHSRTFGRSNTWVVAAWGEQLLPWWLYAPPRSPATRWRTPLWRSSSAAPSAPEKWWWSRLVKTADTNHSTSYHASGVRRSWWLLISKIWSLRH